FARYRIVDPLKFYQAVRTEATFVDLFGRTLNSAVRAEVARNQLATLLSAKRAGIMRNIFAAVSARGQNFGIEVVDVRIGRTELPADVLNDAYERMRSEREREANLLRAEGEEISRRIRAESDRQRTVIIAEAERESSIQRGVGDAARNRILGAAYSRDPEFFDFYRSLEAYRRAFADSPTTLLLSPDSEFFRYFGESINPATAN
ncbi:MAG: protease modulator HflC, partial [Kiloniellales bacterium]